MAPFRVRITRVLAPSGLDHNNFDIASRCLLIISLSNPRVTGKFFTDVQAISIVGCGQKKKEEKKKRENTPTLSRFGPFVSFIIYPHPLKVAAIRVYIPGMYTPLSYSSYRSNTISTLRVIISSDRSKKEKKEKEGSIDRSRERSGFDEPARYLILAGKGKRERVFNLARVT